MAEWGNDGEEVEEYKTTLGWSGVVESEEMEWSNNEGNEVRWRL